MVFCNSFADVFEGRDTMPAAAWEPVQDARLRLFNLIAVTPNLHWQVLTKRPQNILPFKADAIARMSVEEAQAFDAAWQQRVWIGTSVENQKWADIRIPELVKVDAAVRFLSLEPLLGPVDLAPWLGHRCLKCDGSNSVGCRKCKGTGWVFPPQIGWVVIGGESGGGARPYDVAWPRFLIRQCEDAGVPVFHKQLGRRPFGTDRERWRMEGSPTDSLPEKGDELVRLPITKKGSEPNEWLPDLRVREFPKRVALQMVE
jgi:protein gp37